MAHNNTPRSLIWRRKLWELNTGWLGLGLSLVVAFMITQGMKNLFGKPRPDLISRCQPDASNIAAHIVANYATQLNGALGSEWTLVQSSICTQQDRGRLDDGFRSFPSGHCSMSWSGLLYLSLFICSKFAISIPFLPPRSYSQDLAHTAMEARQSSSLPTHEIREDASDTGLTRDAAPVVPIRNQAAAPPLYSLVLAFIPVFIATYICSTRYSDFRHAGFDILFGSFIGIGTSWFAFRWYHLPIQQGAGWAWGARSRDRAWAVGVGKLGYVGTEGWGPERSSTDGPRSGVRARLQGGKRRDALSSDVESGMAGRRDLTGPGLELVGGEALPENAQSSMSRSRNW